MLCSVIIALAFSAKHAALDWNLAFPILLKFVQYRKNPPKNTRNYFGGKFSFVGALLAQAS
jgi:hypothetical protein